MNADGKIWAGSPGGIPLPQDIKYVLDSDYNDIGNLCCSPNVNEWSFRHPVQSLEMWRLSDDEIYECNDGIMRPLLLNSFEDMFDYVGNGQVSWERYSPSVYRFGDFDGYDHKVKRWFDIDIVGSNRMHIDSIIPGENAYMEFINYSYNEERDSSKYTAQWMVDNFDMFSEERGTFHVAAVLYQHNGQNGPSGCYVVVGPEVGDEGKSMHVGLSINENDPDTPEAGDYNVFPCLTTYPGTGWNEMSPSLNNYRWFPLDSEVMPVTIGTIANLLDYIKVYKTSGFISDVTYDDDSGRFTFSIYPGLFEIVNEFSREITVHYSLYYGTYHGTFDASDLTEIYSSNGHTLDIPGNNGSRFTNDPSRTITFDSLTQSVTLVLKITLGGEYAKYYKVSCVAAKGDIEWGEGTYETNYD